MQKRSTKKTNIYQLINKGKKMNKKQKTQLENAKKEFFLYLFDQATDEDILELIDSANQFLDTGIDISLFEEDLIDKGSFEFGPIEEDDSDETEETEETEEDSSDDEDDDLIDENSSKEDYLDYLSFIDDSDIKKLIKYLIKNHGLDLDPKAEDDELIDQLRDRSVKRAILWEAIDEVIPDDEDEDEE